MQLYLLMSKVVLVYSQWYLGEEKQQRTTSIDRNDASKPFPGTSPIQCVLKCQMKLKQGFFVEQEKQCFCVDDEKKSLLRTSRHQLVECCTQNTR